MGSGKPSYEDLERRVRELEAEVDGLRKAGEELEKRGSLAREAEHMALLGHWELDLVTNTLYWSEEIYRIFELTPGQFGATYEAFLETVHPDDREFVNRAYTRSVEERTGYDIVHRLLMKDGSIKHVHERCKTEYGEDGPLRSVGTVQDITEQMQAKQGFAGIVGRDPAMQELFESIRQLADVAVPVVIQGESGTGKELVANAIHAHGPRATSPFVPVNCGALPENLLESELFGHVKGAFTGAVRDKRGRFELAHEGTLFLDEVADLPAPVQVKLLRVLQEGKFERLGDEKTLSADVRIISATNKDLSEEVEGGRFREDLFYRLRVVPVYVPALRDRRSDIPLLVDHFLVEEAREGQRSEGVSREALAYLVDYPWPGNVRELQSAVRFALIKSRGKLVRPEHLPEDIRTHGDAMRGRDRERRDAKPYVVAGKRKRGRAPKLSQASVHRALEKAGGNKVEAAKILGVGRATLYRYLGKKNP
jgi:PAS domain S-box-containing protein